MSVHAVNLCLSAAHDDTETRIHDFSDPTKQLLTSRSGMNTLVTHFHLWFVSQIINCLGGRKSVQTDTRWICLYGSIVTAKYNNNLFMSTKKALLCLLVRLETWNMSGMKDAASVFPPRWFDTTDVYGKAVEKLLHDMRQQFIGKIFKRKRTRQKKILGQKLICLLLNPDFITDKVTKHMNQCLELDLLGRKKKSETK